jgi:hypothetical protein
VAWARERGTSGSVTGHLLLLGHENESAAWVTGRKARREQCWSSGLAALQQSVRCWAIALGSASATEAGPRAATG